MYFPETIDLLTQLEADPTIPLMCSHGGDPAHGIFEVPRGCVALPGLETQCLCPQHVISDGSFEGMNLIVDLSVDAAWTRTELLRRRGDTPDYWIQRSQDTGLMVLRSVLEHPLPELDL
jgi:hypothetical protein